MNSKMREGKNAAPGKKSADKGSRVHDEEDVKYLRKFSTFLRSFGQPIPPAEKYLFNHSELLRKKKGSILVKSGENNSNVFFIIKGVVRGYMKYGSQNITTWIAEEGEMVGTIRNFELPVPSNEELEVIEDAILVRINSETLDYVYDKYPEANRIARLVVSLNYREAEERAYISRIPSAEARYRRFIEYRGELLNRIPLKYIASYLGMKLETLSRIRKKVK
ncbi:MAG: Crp/Fnr family transcriptional regulator [Chitinophagaceae bacterium]|nr:Crp/Fnr family transcriptional regulator [Chitinophagaceae bacterium]